AESRESVNLPNRVLHSSGWPSYRKEDVCRSLEHVAAPACYRNVAARLALVSSQDDPNSEGTDLLERSEKLVHRTGVVLGVPLQSCKLTNRVYYQELRFDLLAFP